MITYSLLMKGSFLPINFLLITVKKCVVNVEFYGESFDSNCCKYLLENCLSLLSRKYFFFVNLKLCILTTSNVVCCMRTNRFLRVVW